MADKNLTVQSSVDGVPVSIAYLSTVYRTVTPVTLVLPEGVTVTTRINANYYDGENYFEFKQWDDGSKTLVRTVTMDADKTITATFETIKYWPTRNPTVRADKYEAKINPDVTENRITKLAPIMKTQYTQTSQTQTSMENTIGQYLNSQGLYGWQIHNYRNYAQQLYALKNKFTGETLNKEATLIAQKWKNRQLNPQHLTKIAELLGIKITL